MLAWCCILACFLAFVPLLALAYVQKFMMTAEQYQNLMFLQIKDHQHLLAMPGLSVTIVVVVTIVDIVRRKDLEKSSRWLLVILVTVFNAGAAIWYWIRELGKVLVQSAPAIATAGLSSSLD